MGLLKLRRQKAIELAKSWEGPAPHARPVPRRPMGIEDLLRWAYREELPKTPRTVAGPAPIGGGWEAMSKWAEELPLAGLDENRFGLVADPFATTWPHSDAVTVHEMVMRLDECEPADFEAWAPIDDLPTLAHEPQLLVQARNELLTVDDAGKSRLRRPVHRLIQRHALLGGTPDWHIEPPQNKQVMSTGGRVKWFVRTLVKTDAAFGQITHEVEQDGFDYRLRIPKPDAYTKTYLDPDPVPGIVERGEYDLWRAALDMLVDDLAPLLTTIVPLRSARPAQPWVWQEESAQVRVLPDLSAQEPIAQKSRRRSKKLTVGA